MGTNVLCPHVIGSLGADFKNRWKRSRLVACKQCTAHGFKKREAIGGKVSWVEKYSQRNAPAGPPQRCESPGHVLFALHDEEQMMCWQ